MHSAFLHHSVSNLGVLSEYNAKSRSNKGKSLRLQQEYLKYLRAGISLVVQWLKNLLWHAGDTDWIPDRGTKIQQQLSSTPQLESSCIKTKDPHDVSKTLHAATETMQSNQSILKINKVKHLC